MPLIYPVRAGANEDADADDAFEDFLADWSETWILEVEPGDNDIVRLGPLGPAEAWDLAHEIDERRGTWRVSIVPLFAPGATDATIAEIEG